MADEMVARAQRFVNVVYGDRIGVRVEENGRTGWSTVYALTRALQWELGITALSDSFGPGTLSALATRFPVLSSATVPSANFCRIIQSAMYCKGYDGGDIDGIWSARVENALITLKTDMGVQAQAPGGGLTPKMVKGLFTMDAYVTVGDGSPVTREAQRWLNGRYLNRRDFFVIPCDGRNSRDVARSMLLAIQYELGMADGVANGVFGPGTRTGLRSRTVAVGSTGVWVSLFTAAMNLNLRPAAFSGSFTSALAAEVRAFQSFVRLPVTGDGDYQTWASLLVSYGDQDRRGEACDGVTRITPARADALKAVGVRYVGRYLTSARSTLLPEKAIQPGELQTIADSGLRCFPIYQTYGREAAGYDYPAGRAAGYAAGNAAVDHGFKNGTRIYFAVDFDALDQEITANVLPYFKGIEDSLADAGSPFAVGVYGPRNVCIRVAEAGHSTASFVSDMSSGFSGNYGYPLPPNWAFDQIVTRTVGAGAGLIEIDVDIASGRDTGQNSFNPARAVLPDKLLDPSLHLALSNDVGRYMESIGFPLNGGIRNFSHDGCLRQAVLDQDGVATEMSNRHSMRKALIQTSAYWEMRHIGAEDDAQDLRVQAYHNNIPGGVRDSSTGVAQITANAAIRAWNHAIARGYETGTTLDPESDADIYAMWNRVRDDAFAVRTVAVIHLWDADGKPGGNNPPAGETDMRPVALDYTDQEIFNILRRYQGFGTEAELHAGRRMALYYIFEKYNAISRHL